jgi:hypothetical protein
MPSASGSLRRRSTADCRSDFITPQPKSACPPFLLPLRLHPDLHDGGGYSHHRQGGRAPPAHPENPGAADRGSGEIMTTFGPASDPSRPTSRHKRPAHGSESLPAQGRSQSNQNRGQTTRSSTKIIRYTHFSAQKQHFRPRLMHNSFIGVDR